jgi:hypothetical protein
MQAANTQQQQQEEVDLVPVLVSGYDKSKLVEKPFWYVQEKYDGIRCVYRNGVFYTKHGHVITPDAGTVEILSDIGQLLMNAGRGDMVLDGEYFRGYTHKTIQTIPNTGANPPAYHKDALYARFVVFDAPSIEGPYQERFEWLKETIQNTKTLFIANTLVVDGSDMIVPHGEHAEQVDKFYNEIIKKGGEGIVYKPVDFIYEWGVKRGKRLQLLMKRKHADYDEVTITGYHTTKQAAAQGREGYVSAYVVEGASFDSSFKVTCKTNDPYPIGTKITIKFNQYHAANYIPKFPSVVGVVRSGSLLLDSCGGEGGNNGEEVVIEPVKPIEPRFPPRKAPKKLPDECLSLLDWYKNSVECPRVLNPSEKVTVIGSHGDNYIVQCARAGNVYCTCPAWLWQKEDSAIRTCKHCVAVCGVEAIKAQGAKFDEEKIINAILNIKPTKKSKKAKQSADADDGAADMNEYNKDSNIFRWG